LFSPLVRKLRSGNVSFPFPVGGNNLLKYRSWLPNKASTPLTEGELGRLWDYEKFERRSSRNGVQPEIAASEAVREVGRDDQSQSDGIAAYTSRELSKARRAP
jgi:hypothetical protein